MESYRPFHEPLETVSVDHDRKPRAGDCDKDEHVAELAV
jgi:hypothetical protein